MCEEKLRDELLAWQAGQRELHRWKLIAIGGVAALGLGLTSEKGEPQILVLCLVPFIAAYCDALLRDHDLRIGLIGFFLIKQGGPFSEYEQFVEAHLIGSSRWWYLGKNASMSSSFGACVLTAAAGVYGLLFGNFKTQARLEFYATLLSAAIGMLLIMRVQNTYSRSYDKLRKATAGERKGA